VRAAHAKQPITAAVETALVAAADMIVEAGTAEMAGVPQGEVRSARHSPLPTPRHPAIPTRSAIP